MRDIDIKVDWKDAERRLKRFDGAMASSTRYILNWAAVMGARRFKKSFHREFTIRNNSTDNTTFPREKFGNNARGLGFVPPSNTDWPSMYSRAGTIADYMVDQEEGFTVKDPYAPTDFARIGKSPKKVISSSARLQRLKQTRALTPKAMKKPDTKDKKIRAMLGMIKREKHKGFILIEDKNDILPPGYYKVNTRKGKARKISGKKRIGTLRLWRLLDKGRKVRRARKWFEPVLSDILSQDEISSKWIHVLDKYCSFLDKK